MKYDKMWYKLKENLILIGNGVGMDVDILIGMMNEIEIEENKQSNKTLWDLSKRVHPNT